MTNLVALSGNSKVKTIEYSLGTQYGTSFQLILFGFKPIPESVKTHMDFLVHSISPSLEGRVAPVESPSSSEIPEGANLFEEAEKRKKALDEQKTFVSCADAERISRAISERLNTEVKVLKQRNPEQDRIARQAEMDARSKAFGKQFARAILQSITASLGETFNPEESSDEEILDSQPSSSSSAPVELSEDEKFIVTHLEIREIDAFTKVVGILNEEGFLSKIDTTAISNASLTKQIHDNIVFRKELSQHLSSEQTQALKSFFDSFVAPLIDRCEQLDTPEKVLGHVTWETLAGPIVPRDIAFAALVHCASRCHSMLLLEQFGGLKELTESGQMLEAIFRGTTGMEALLKSLGIAVPSLEHQRAVLFEYFEEKLEERFGPEDLSKIPAEFNPALVKELRKQLFIDGYFLNMIERKDFTNIEIQVRPDGSCGYASKPPMTINTFSGTLFPLQGRFLSFNWSTHDCHYIEGEAALNRFASMKEKAEKRLNLNSSETSSSLAASSV